MPNPKTEYFPLASAYLCEDCQCVGNTAIRCPACASTALMNMALVLNRDADAVGLTPNYLYQAAARAA
jgi:hypothetical protein